VLSWESVSTGGAAYCGLEEAEGDRSDPGEVNRPSARCSSGGARNGSPRRSWHRADRRTAGPSGRSGG